MKVREKPAIFEAVQVLRCELIEGGRWEGAAFSEMPALIEEAVRDGKIHPSVKGATDYLTWEVHAKNGTITATPGDWIVLNHLGGLRVCDDFVFHQTYEPVDSDKPKLPPMRAESIGHKIEPRSEPVEPPGPPDPPRPRIRRDFA